MGKLTKKNGVVTNTVEAYASTLATCACSCICKCQCQGGNNATTKSAGKKYDVNKYLAKAKKR